MPKQILEWQAEHANFRRLLDLLESQISLFHEGTRPDYELMQDIVYYLVQFPDRFHHPREDEAFARLLEKDPDLRATIQRLSAEHRILAASGKQLLELLEAVVNGAIMPREAVDASAATYVAYYRQHLELEEGGLIPRAAQMLGPEDWRAAAAAGTSGVDPLFGEKVEQRYRDLRRHIILESGTR